MELNTADTHAAASHETRAGTYAHTKCAILPQLLLLSSSSVTIAALPRDSDTVMGLYKQRGPSGRSNGRSYSEFLRNRVFYGVRTTGL